MTIQKGIENDEYCAILNAVEFLLDHNFDFDVIGIVLLIMLHRIRVLDK